MLIPMILTAYFVTWVIVRSRIASPLVERWQMHWEGRWIRKHAADEVTEAAYWETNEWNSDLAYLPTCAYCAGFWVSGAVVGITALVDGVPHWYLTWPALAGAVGLIDSLTHREA